MDNAPKLPTIWLMPLSNAPQHPGFQESEQETAPATSDFWNPTLTAHMMVLDFRNRNWKRVRRSLQHGRVSLFHLIIHKR